MSELVEYSGADLAISRSPDAVLAEASLVGKAVERLVKQRPDLVQVIGGRKHPRFELLQIVGSMFRLTTRVRETRHIICGDVEGWEAIAEAVHVPSGQIVSVAEGMCTTDEPDWAVRPKYEWRNGRREKIGEVSVTSHQRRSMAQTRACSKALRLAIGWVLGMAGYEATAAEEVAGSDETQAALQIRRKSERTEQQAQSRVTITEAQAKRLWAIARSGGLSDEQVAGIIRTFGIEHTRQIPVDMYDHVVERIREVASQEDGREQGEGRAE
jgi:hypothetical protein